MSGKLLTGAQVAEILGVSKSYAYRLMREGAITTVRIGRTVRVRETDLDEYIQRCLRPATNAISILPRGRSRN